MYANAAQTVVYTGPIDAYFNYKLGQLEYRALGRSQSKGPVMNYTDRETPYTRSIEHKPFEFGMQLVTYVTKEYPMD